MNFWLCFRVLSVFLLLLGGLFIGWKLAAEEPPTMTDSPPLEIPDFIPLAQSSDPPPVADIPLLARLRQEIGSPLETSTWQPYSGNSPLASPQASEFSNSSLAITIKQLQASAVSLETAAVEQECQANYDQADQLRKLAKRLWKDARRIEGWSRAD